MKKNKIDEFIKKIHSIKDKDKLDLSSDQDLSIAIMNLIGIEEHFFFTGVKTEKVKYFDLLNEVRNIRKDLLARLIKNGEGEVWCISKHLLASSYRLMEVGTKQLSLGNKKEAYDFFNKSYKLYSLFWGINMNLLNIGDVKAKENVFVQLDKSSKNIVMQKLSKIVTKIVNCCRE